MMDSKDAMLLRVVRQAAHTLRGAATDYDPLLDLIGDRFVLLGEASHGTHDFYDQRAQITKRLIEEKGFTAVAVEADWPDAYRVNRYVRGTTDDADSEEPLSGFKRFPTWMFRNADVLDFVGWLREPRLERSIGVIYRPESERASHYFHARLSDQFDAALHFDETRAVEPLERSAPVGGEVEEETFPSGV